MDNTQDRLGDGRAGCVASDMNAIGENLAALKNPAAVMYETTEEIDTTLGREFVDIDSTNLNLTLTTTGGDVMVHFNGSVRRHDSTHNCTEVYFDLMVDGKRMGDTNGILQAGPAVCGENVSIVRLIQNLSAGTHTFKLQWRGNRRVRLTTNTQFWVREI